MARARKHRFQLLRTIVLGAVVFIMLGMIVGGLAESVIVFMLTGIVRGTTFVVPVWGMFAIYAAIVSFLLLTYAVDRELEKRHLTEQLAKKRLSRRRYSHS